MISTPIIYDFAGFWNRLSGQNSREYDILVTVQVGPRACHAEYVLSEERMPEENL